MVLEEQELREWVRRVAHGQASRRQFMRTMLGLGLSGPLLADLLAGAAPVAAQDTPGGQPTLNRWARAPTGSLTSNREMWHSLSSIRTITCPTVPSLTRWS
jgi:hypothetical protein